MRASVRLGPSPYDNIGLVMIWVGIGLMVVFSAGFVLGLDFAEITLLGVVVSGALAALRLYGIPLEAIMYGIDRHEAARKAIDSAAFLPTYVYQHKWSLSVFMLDENARLIWVDGVVASLDQVVRVYQEKTSFLRPCVTLAFRGAPVDSVQIVCDDKKAQDALSSKLMNLLKS